MPSQEQPALRRPAVERAPAKLTTRLRVVGVRPDDGYHLLDAEMVSLDLADELSFHDPDDPAGPGPGRTLEVVDEVGLAVEVPDGPDNLVRRALRACGVDEGSVSIRLTKRIPAGGGLGGGSADAAAVLRWAGRATQNGDDLGLAAGLGADVPFCVRGGRARVAGVGEVLEPLPPEPGTAYTLLTPPLAVSTPAVYRAWDELGGPTSESPNDLEPAALAVEPLLARWRDALAERTGATPVLAGSGATWFVPGAHEGDVLGVRLVVARTTEAVSGAGGPEG